MNFDAVAHIDAIIYGFVAVISRLELEHPSPWEIYLSHKVHKYGQ